MHLYFNPEKAIFGEKETRICRSQDDQRIRKGRLQALGALLPLAVASLTL